MGGAKVTLIGAGSHVFGLRLAVDLMTYPELRGSTLNLMDIDKDRLEFTARLVRIAAEQSKAEIRIYATTDRREALKDADYVVTSIRAGVWRLHAWISRYLLDTGWSRVLEIRSALEGYSTV